MINTNIAKQNHIKDGCLKNFYHVLNMLNAQRIVYQSLNDTYMVQKTDNRIVDTENDIKLYLQDRSELIKERYPVIDIMKKGQIINLVV